MLDNARMARRLEHREMAFEIAVLIGEGIFETVAHACLRGEVDDPADAVRFHQLADQPGAGDVAVDQPEIEMIGKPRSEEHTSELQSLMRISYAVFCLKKKTKKTT